MPFEAMLEVRNIFFSQNGNVTGKDTDFIFSAKEVDWERVVIVYESCRPS